MGDQSEAETLPDNTQHSKEKDIHDPGEIRTRNPSKQGAADPRRRLRGHWDRHCSFLTFPKQFRV
jgi:hypothetical protein